MEENIIVKKLKDVICENDKIYFLSGVIEQIGNEDCRLSDSRGSVYGVAIKLKDESDKKQVFKAIPEERRNNTKVENWKPIDENYYPLYWGKDINMGIRIHSHTRSMKSTGTLQLNTLQALKGREVIYGVLPCLNCEKHEKQMHEKYPDILKTIKGKCDQLEMSSVNQDEDI